MLQEIHGFNSINYDDSGTEAQAHLKPNEGKGSLFLASIKKAMVPEGAAFSMSKR